MNFHSWSCLSFQHVVDCLGGPYLATDFRGVCRRTALMIVPPRACTAADLADTSALYGDVPNFKMACALCGDQIDRCAIAMQAGRGGHPAMIDLVDKMFPGYLETIYTGCVMGDKLEALEKSAALLGHIHKYSNSLYRFSFVEEAIKFKAAKIFKHLCVKYENLHFGWSQYIVGVGRSYEILDVMEELGMSVNTYDFTLGVCYNLDMQELEKVAASKYKKYIDYAMAFRLFWTSYIPKPMFVFTQWLGREDVLELYKIAVEQKDKQCLSFLRNEHPNILDRATVKSLWVRH